MQRFALTAALAFGTGVPAVAEISPQELWQSWQGENSAIAATGTTAPEGDTLVVNDARLSIGDVTAEIGRLVLAPEGEGTRVELPAEWQLRNAALDATVTAPGASLLATGAASDPVYRLEAPALGVSMNLDGQPVTLTMDALQGLFASTALDLEATRLSLVGEKAEGAPAIRVERTNPKLTFAGPIEALADLAAGEQPADAVLTLTSTESMQVITLPELNAPTVTVGSGATQDTVTVKGAVISVEQSLQDVALSVDGPTIPLPDASAAIASVELSASGPATPGEEPAPFSLALTLDGVTVAEQAWQLIDPKGELPRDPAVLELVLNGQALRRGASQIAVERAALESLRLEAMGALLRGQGSVLFQAPGEGPYGRPIGSFAFTLDGALALLDQLDTMGTLPTGALVGARLGLGMFTRPGTGEDSLTTAVEIGPQGSISVNGRPVMSLP